MNTVATIAKNTETLLVHETLLLFRGIFYDNKLWARGGSIIERLPATRAAGIRFPSRRTSSTIIPRRMALSLSAVKRYNGAVLVTSKSAIQH